jgi:CheY-like chemotaxis protein
MFSQLDSAIDRAEGGLGIGLALVKGLIELHGGSVEALSAGLGQGSEFIIRLPRTVVIPGSVPSPQRVFTGGPVGGCKVLIADDNRDAADSLAMILKLSGYEVVLAYSGKEAITAALRERPEALILDIGMPDATGYEVAERLRQEPWGRSALLLAITGWGQEDDKKRAKAAGFDEHLTKPVDAGQVEQVLSAFLQQRTTSRTERDGTIKVAGHQSVG